MIDSSKGSTAAGVGVRFAASKPHRAVAPTVSVVIPTYNRLERLRGVLEALSSQTAATNGFEVVVVSDGATDGTDEFVSAVEMPYELVFVSQPNRGPAAARNRAVALASSQLLVFLDDDVIPTPELIEQHLVTHAQDPGALVVVGPMLDPPGYRRSPLVRWEQAMLYKQYDAMRRGDYPATYRQFYTGNASVSRERLLDAGGFDERFRRAEDVELAYRLHVNGAKFVFNERAVGHHYAERSFASWIRTAHDYGRNDIVFTREHGCRDRLFAAQWEFHGRHVLTRFLTGTCIGRPRLESSLRWPARGIVAVAERLGLEGLTKFVLSGLYNTSYYCGMAEELGSAQAFRNLMKVADEPVQSA
jgi:GT2 family glycosyltransferase